MMNRNEIESVAQQVGAQGVDNLIADAGRICMYEQERIKLQSEPEIVRLQGELAILSAEERHIAERLAHAPASGGLRRLRIKRVFYWATALVLACSGFFGIMLSLAPFRLGWMSWLLAAGAAVLTQFLVDHLLEKPGMDKVLLALTAIAATASLASVMLFAAIRGDLLAQQIHESEAQTVIIEDTQPQPQAPNTFYERTAGMLAIALLLLAFATETGGGLVLHAAWKSMPDESEDWTKLRRELRDMRSCMAEVARQITALRNAPLAFGASFWTDFYRALLLNATRSAMTKRLVILIAFLALFASQGRAEDHLNLIIAIDLTRSVAGLGPDGKTDFEKNVQGVGRLLAQVPAGSGVTVIGITDRSFTQPYMLMQARVPDDSGYFGERLNAAHGRLAQAWQQRSAHLSPDFNQTDIFGALELVSQLFAQYTTSRKELVIFSDMRESVPGLDFERTELVPAFATVASRCGQLSDLHGIKVQVAGVDGAGKTIVFWQSLRNFWLDYFKNAGASLDTFTVLTDLPLALEPNRKALATD